jgi:hypothetical protein
MTFELSYEKATVEIFIPFLNVYNLNPVLRSHKITFESNDPVKTFVSSYDIATLVIIFE